MKKLWTFKFARLTTWNFNVIPMVNSRINYREEVGSLLLGLGHVSVLSLMEVHNLKLVPFSFILFTLCTWLVHEVLMNLFHHPSPHPKAPTHLFPLVSRIKECVLNFRFFYLFLCYPLKVHLSNLWKNWKVHQNDYDYCIN